MHLFMLALAFSSITSTTSIITSAATSTTNPTTYTIDATTLGPRLDGFGAISGGGATSRLLFSYSPAVTSQILDLLFLPKFGASLHHLKVEIGGDGQSSEGVEPSHMHTEDSPPDFNRGYEARLMVEARARNPGILLSALAWTWPGWVGSGTSSPWTNTTASIRYIITWLQGMRDTHNITLNYLNADWNERGWSADFVIRLRSALDSSGFSYLGLVCGDDAHAFACAAEAARNATLRSSIVALGSHGPKPPSPALLPNLPLWNTEVHVTDPAGSDLAGIFAAAYLTQNITSGTLWNVLSAYNPGLFSPDWGIFRAWWPWCDYYEPVGKLWVFAHWTQGTAPGMHWLPEGPGGGNLAGGGVYVSFLHPTTHQFTLIVYKPAVNTTQEEVSFTLLSPSLANVTTLYPVKSTLGVGGFDMDMGMDMHAAATATTPPDLGAYFLTQPALAVDPGSHTTTQPLTIPPGTLWTFTSLPGQFIKGAPERTVLSPTPFPATYHDDFEACPPSQEAPYFTDMTGAFECTMDGAGGRGVVMAQSVPMHPVAWRPEEQRPFSLFAADISLTSVNTSIDFAFSAPGEGVLFGVRANPNCCGRVITGEDLMPGAWLWVGSSGDFTLFNAIANVTTASGVIAKGKASGATIPPLQWHTLGLVLLKNTLAATFDGAVLFQGVSVDEAATGVPANGFVGIGTQAWGQYVKFDRFVYQALD